MFGNTNGFGIIGLLLVIVIVSVFGMAVIRNGNIGILRQQRTVPYSARNAVREAKHLKNILESKNVIMKISSPSFLEAAFIPIKHTCDEENVSPSLVLRDVPAGAKSLVLIMDDPDAPGGTWVHWTVWNINPAVREISEGSAPEGSIEGKTSFGTHGYGGPCPPSGTHRYYFKLYALDTLLNVPLTSEADDIEEAIKGHILADAKLMGIYERQ